MVKVYLGLGSNLGVRLKNLEKACIAIGIEAGQIIDRSHVYETEPWGFSSQHNFLNMVVCIETAQNPGGLLLSLQKIETRIGRIRKGIGYSPRIIDIDILLYDDQLITSKNLIIPHPLFHERRFVLKPLSDIAPDLLHPVLNRKITDLLSDCMDQSRVDLFPARITTIE